MIFRRPARATRRARTLRSRSASCPSSLINKLYWIMGALPRSLVHNQVCIETEKLFGFVPAVPFSTARDSSSSTRFNIMTDFRKSYCSMYSLVQMLVLWACWIKTAKCFDFEKTLVRKPDQWACFVSCQWWGWLKWRTCSHDRDFASHWPSGHYELVGAYWSRYFVSVYCCVT